MAESLMLQSLFRPFEVVIQLMHHIKITELMTDMSYVHRSHAITLSSVRYAIEWKKWRLSSRRYLNKK
jgi:hypothetical protein